MCGSQLTTTQRDPTLQHGPSDTNIILSFINVHYLGQKRWPNHILYQTSQTSCSKHHILCGYARQGVSGRTLRVQACTVQYTSYWPHVIVSIYIKLKIQSLSNTSHIASVRYPRVQWLVERTAQTRDTLILSDSATGKHWPRPHGIQKTRTGIWARRREGLRKPYILSLVL